MDIEQKGVREPGNNCQALKPIPHERPGKEARLQIEAEPSYA